ncbi:hypothetical protein [Brevibacterium album]|uniref:hypothetical protein n=1 Tax=Brevibacterium album TaxID=417948 RepID=UPI00042A2694|nr:hypothetical protein [Brevibacterium album]
MRPEGQGAEEPFPEGIPDTGVVRDTAAEVDAAFRTVRRIAVTYFLVFLALLISFPVLTMTLAWWTESRVLGFSPAFLTAALGLYAAFAVVGVAAATLASSVESRMLGGRSARWEPGDSEADVLPARRGANRHRARTAPGSVPREGGAG